MNMEVLKKALLTGIPCGILSWLIYGLVFRVLIDKLPVKEALLDRRGLIFLAAVTIVEIIVTYFTVLQKNKKN